jgi:hypothetical protein
VSPDSDPTSFLPTGLTRCLVVGRIEDVPSGWIEQVRAGRGAVEAVAHPFIAFAEALRHEVADRLRPSFGLARQESIAIVFAGEAFRDDRDSIAAAIRAHAPQVGVWSIDRGKIRRLSSDGSPGAVRDEPRTDAGKPPSLRLAGTDPVPPREEIPEPAPVAPPVAAKESRPPLDASVTPEEIEMLLRMFEAGPDGEPDGRKESSR